MTRKVLPSVCGRADDLARFYSLIDRLERAVGGQRILSSCTGRLSWPGQGVYFFSEQGEMRTTSGVGGRIVRVGTHGLRANTNTTLWGRLRQHKGDAKSGGGNHRGSVFRLLVGEALIARRGDVYPEWGIGRSAPKHVRDQERPLEREVSETIGAMRILWLAVDDRPGPESARGDIERNTIALLSNYRRPFLDPPSPGWLGLHTGSKRIRESGLWNSDHIDETYDPRFLDRLELFVESSEVHA